MKQGNARITNPKQPTRKGAESEGVMTAPIGDDTPNKTPKTANLSPPWQPGQSGNPNGRPKGARARLADDFCQALLDDFAEAGPEAIKLMRAEKPNEYARMIASIIPKEIDAAVTGEFSDEMKRWLGIG